MLKKQAMRKNFHQKESKNTFEDEFRAKINSLILNNPNALVSKEYHDLLEAYNKRLINNNSSKEDITPKNDNVNVIRKDRVDSKTALSRLFSEQNESEKESESKPNSVVKNIIFYAITALIFWFIKKYF